MPQITTIADIAQHDGQEVSISGWLYSIRSSGKIAFPQLRDGTGIIQCVAKRAVINDDAFEALRRLGQESSLTVTGSVHADERAPGGFELQISGLTVHQNASGYPITKKEHGPAFLHDHRHLWFRSKRQQRT